MNKGDIFYIHLTNLEVIPYRIPPTYANIGEVISRIEGDYQDELVWLTNDDGTVILIPKRNISYITIGPDTTKSNIIQVKEVR